MPKSRLCPSARIFTTQAFAIQTCQSLDFAHPCGISPHKSFMSTNLPTSQFCMSLWHFVTYIFKMKTYQRHPFSKRHLFSTFSMHLFMSTNLSKSGFCITTLCFAMCMLANPHLQKTSFGTNAWCFAIKSCKI